MYVGVIGAGPAGLAAACALRSRGISCCLYEAGQALGLRRHDNADHLGMGVGGAGLFSDGKFSYYPSGSSLYTLQDKERLKDAYEWMYTALSPVGIGYERFPDKLSMRTASAAGSISQKVYPVHMTSTQQRRDLTQFLEDSAGIRARTNHRVLSISRSQDGYELAVQAEHSGKTEVETVAAIILAGGRFGSLLISGLDGILPLSEQRYEYGIRLETSHSLEPMAEKATPDIKYIWEEDGVQFRTFCSCKAGELWNVRFPCGSALSGRSDGIKTTFSNVSVLARFQGAQLAVGRQLWNESVVKVFEGSAAVWEPISSFLNGSAGSANPKINGDRPWAPSSSFLRGSLKEVLGDHLHGLMRSAVKTLVEKSPQVFDDTTVCVAPAIEGVGFYPDCSDTLRVGEERIWVAGDLTGWVRGIVPALATGYYAGLSVE